MNWPVRGARTTWRRTFSLRAADSWRRRLIASGLVLALTAPFGTVAIGQTSSSTAQPDNASRSAPAQTPEPTQTQNVTPETNGVLKPSNTQGTPPEATDESKPSPSQPVTGNQRSSAPPSAPQPEVNEPSKQPLGTAVAPTETVTGVAASRPAGAAIAPAKQRRVRSILIKVGIILGAAVAIGTVAAMSKGSPSRPN